MAKKSQSFEQSITRLDEIVRQLEQGNVPLEDALKLFQEGTALVDTCGKLLDKAELEVVNAVSALLLCGHIVLSPLVFSRIVTSYIISIILDMAIPVESKK